VKHFLLNDHENGGNLSLVTPLENQVLMNQLNSEVFPLLHLQQQYHEDGKQASTETGAESSAEMSTATRAETKTETSAITSTETNTETGAESNSDTETKVCTIFSYISMCTIIPYYLCTCEVVYS
jgi:hypothetical protein